MPEVDNAQSAIDDTAIDASMGGGDRMMLLGILSGTWLAQAGYAMAKLGVPDLMADGPREASDLAAECGANADALRRMLRALASVGLFEQLDESRFGLTAATQLLRSGVQRSARLGAIMYGEEVFRSFADVLYTVETGAPSFDKVYGLPFYEYLAANPEANARFNEAMGGLREVPAVLDRCDLSGVRTLVDVGGGNGNLLADFLSRDSGLRGVLLERPEVLDQARARLSEAGVLDRSDLVGGTFFDSVPSGGDAYVLSRCLHNWNDERATDILRAVRAAMEPGQRLIVLEKLIPEGPGFSPSKLIDLLMLVMVDGRDRTEAEYRALLDGAGFEVVASHAAPVPDPRAEGAVEAIAI